MTKSTTFLFPVLDERFGASSPVTGVMDPCLPGTDILSVLTGRPDQVWQAASGDAGTVPPADDFDPGAAPWPEAWPGSEAAMSAQRIVDGLSHAGLIVDPVDTGLNDVWRTDDAAGSPCPDLA